MFYGYHITINRKTSDIDAAYKIFFIILGQGSKDHRPSSLLWGLFLFTETEGRENVIFSRPSVML